MGTTTSLNWNQLVEERNAWVNHNFPDPEHKRTPLDSVLGVIEELGELTHHHLKQVQAIRGDDAHHEAESKDAIGDLTIYLLGVMSYYRAFPRHTQYFYRTKDLDVVILKLTTLVGVLAANQSADQLLPHRSYIVDMVTRIVNRLDQYCQIKGWSYPHIVQDTWTSVSKRDWITYPDTGLPPTEQAA